MQKIACVFSFKESSWVSCQKIVFNLHKAYQLCSKTELKNFNFPHVEVEVDAVTSLANEILEYDPEVITFLDHKPHPYPLMQILVPLYNGRKKPKLVFHIFGDFTIYYQQWQKMGALIEEFEVEFLVASDRQKILIDSMFKNNPTVVCPFPVDPKEFHFNQSARKKQRDTWKLTDKDVVYLFTGRLSRQKRIKTLITTFAQEFAIDSNAHLYIYGSPDNIGDPFLGVYDMEGEYFSVINSAYKKIDQKIRNRIHFMGAVPNQELLNVYQGADVLMNLSVHNDEDYGMSVAEAQATGLVSCLTDWGGLASFYHPEIPEAVKFIPVKFGMRAKLISTIRTKSSMREYFKDPKRELREKIAAKAQEKFGIKKGHQVIEGVLKRKSPHFKGFTPFFTKVLNANFISYTDSMYMTKRSTISKLFKEVYSAYVRKH